MTPLGIIVVLTTLPAYISPYINKFFIGNPNGRLYNNNTIEQVGFVRDYEFAGGKVWKFNGLEVIPDK